MQEVVVVWLGRDLRLHDNPALSAALLTARKVVIAYVWAPEEEGQFQPGRASRWWLYHSLRTLEKQIEARGSFICYRRGPCAVDQLLEICREVSASVVYFNNVYDPLSLIRDHEVKRRLSRARIVARNFNAELLFEPWAILDDDGSPYTTFAGFWDRIMKMSKPPAAPSFVEPSVIPSVNDPCLRRLKLDDLMLISSSERWAHSHFSDKWTPGTKAGLMLLVDFLDNRLPEFDKDKAKIDRDSTSRLSPYIHFGEVSVRVIYHEVKQHEATLSKKNGDVVNAFLKQLGYREYSRYLSFHFPFTHERSLLEHVRAVPWIHCPVRFKAWRQGMTGYPIVDAAMRQLLVTGWMHNRARVFTASFLVKNLLLPWQWGLKHFWDMLLDADLECDALGWQYVAGCLRDAHPFTHLMDFETESQRFDPDGAFVRKWVPELAQVPLEHIHHPWDAPQEVLTKAGVVLGVAYPAPIVSVAESRAAVDHAYGVVQKCMYIRSLNPEPYQLPTVPIKMEVLEPEEEVDQTLRATGIQSGSQEGENSAVAIRALGSNSQQQLHVSALGNGIALREEQIPPSCIIPELPPVCNLNQCTSSVDASVKASCGNCSPVQDKGMHKSHTVEAARSESCCASVNDATWSQQDVPSFLASGVNHHLNLEAPPTAYSHAETDGQQSICLSGTNTVTCRKAEGEQDHASFCPADELANCSNSANGIETRLVGFIQASTTDSQREQGACADIACVQAEKSSLLEKVQGQVPLVDDKRDSETTCIKRQRAAGAKSQSEADVDYKRANTSP